LIQYGEQFLDDYSHLFFELGAKMANDKKFAVWIPMFNSSGALGPVIEELSKLSWPRSTHFFFLDNCSADDSAEIAVEKIREFKLENAFVFTNGSNLGLGGSQKQALQQSRINNYDYVAIFHSDFQPAAQDLFEMINSIDELKVDALLGSRFMQESKRQNYPQTRFLGNILLNLLFSMRFGAKISDLGSGLNVYRTSALPELKDLPNDLSFNCNLLVRSIKSDGVIRFYPITWREGLAPSSLKSIKLGLQTLKSLFVVGNQKFVVDTPKPFLVG